MNKPAIEPRGAARTNTDFFRALTRRLGFDEPHLHVSDEVLMCLALAGDDPLMRGITFERLERDGWACLDVPENHACFGSL